MVEGTEGTEDVAAQLARSVAALKQAADIIEVCVWLGGGGGKNRKEKKSP